MNIPAIRTAAVAALVSGCLAALPVQAAGQKFGYVNPERVYTETQAARRIEAALQQEFAPQQQKLAAMQQEAVRLQRQIALDKSASAKRKQAEARLAETARRYRLAAAQLAEEYNLRRNEEFAALQQSANDIIRGIAEKEKYDLIVQEAVYVTGRYDITDRVIKLLDEAR